MRRLFCLPRCAAFGLLGLLGLSGGCGRSPVADERNVLRISQRNEPADLDPARASLPDEFFIIRALSEGLLLPAPDGGPPLPAAAESWTVSADGRVYVFRLRAGLLWSDGEPLTAADFVASWRRTLLPATAAPKASLFFAVKNARAFATGALRDFSAVGLRAPDARTVAITLERPVPRFPYYVASGPWIPVNPRTVARFGRSWTRPGNFVGNGPFLLASWAPHQRIAVRKNPRYRDAPRVLLDGIAFLAFDYGDTEERAYRAGQVDVTMAVPFAKLATYREQRPAELHHAPLAETRYLAFNTARPPLDDPRVRQALALVLDRRKIVDRVLRGGQQPADRFLPPSLRPPGSAAGRDVRVREDATAARLLLADAGFREGRGFPVLELSGWAETPVLEAVQEMWRRELGIETTIAVREARVHLAALRAGRYDIAFATEIPDVADPAAVLGDFAGAAPDNYPHWSDPAYDALLAAAAAAADPERRAALLQEAEARLVDAAPVTPLYFNAQNWLMSPRVAGWREDALWTRYYRDVSLRPR